MLRKYSGAYLVRRKIECAICIRELQFNKIVLHVKNIQARRETRRRLRNRLKKFLLLYFSFRLPGNHFLGGARSCCMKISRSFSAFSLGIRLPIRILPSGSSSTLKPGSFPLGPMSM